MNKKYILSRLEQIFQVYPGGGFYPTNEREVDDLLLDIRDGNKLLSRLIKALRDDINS